MRYSLRLLPSVMFARRAGISDFSLHSSHTVHEPLRWEILWGGLGKKTGWYLDFFFWPVSMFFILSMTKINKLLSGEQRPFLLAWRLFVIFNYHIHMINDLDTKRFVGHFHKNLVSLILSLRWVYFYFMIRPRKERRTCTNIPSTSFLITHKKKKWKYKSKSFELEFQRQTTDAELSFALIDLMHSFSSSRRIWGSLVHRGHFVCSSQISAHFLSSQIFSIYSEPSV